MVYLWIVINLILGNITYSSWLSLNPGLHFTLAMYSPAITALVFALLERRNLRATFPIFPKHFRPVIESALMPIIIGTFVVGIGFLTGLITQNADGYKRSIFANILFQIIAGMGEEIGWRGYLHSKLRNVKHFPLYIGIIWFCWHLHGLILNNQTHSYIILVFFIMMILMSYFLAFIREKGGGLMSVSIFHGLWNFINFNYLFSTQKSAVFISTKPHITNMEGVFGLIGCLFFVTPYIWYWYNKMGKNN